MRMRMRMRTSESLRILQECSSRTFLNTCQLRLDICIGHLCMFYLFLVVWLLWQSQRSYVYQRSIHCGAYCVFSNTYDPLSAFLPSYTVPHTCLLESPICTSPSPHLYPDHNDKHQRRGQSLRQSYTACTYPPTV
jgi:hypothetical protein